MTLWEIKPGTVTTRAAVAETYGGSTLGGIQPSTTTANIMIYSDPTVGQEHGYNFDGFGTDGAYYYTGEGQVGDQKLRAGNLAVLEHDQTQRSLRVFEAAGPKRPGGKPQRYLGGFRLDREAPYRLEVAPDRNGASRTVLVFRLLPLGPVAPSLSSTVAATPDRPLQVKFVPSERNRKFRFTPTPDITSNEAWRAEAELMAALERHLESLGHATGRFSIRPAGDKSPMLTDTVDRTAGELYEVKPTASRDHVRAAVAQLLDYRRHLPEVAACTVLLPTTPTDDLQNYGAACGLGLAILDSATDRIIRGVVH